MNDGVTLLTMMSLIFFILSYFIKQKITAPKGVMRSPIGAPPFFKLEN
jgi:hypothetical protein